MMVVGTVFKDADKNESEFFPPNIELSDLDECHGPKVKRLGFLAFKKAVYCGATIEFHEAIETAARNRKQRDKEEHKKTRYLNVNEVAELRRRIEAGEDISDFLN